MRAVWYGGPQGQYKNIYSITKIYFQYKNIYIPVQKYLFQYKKYISSTKIYFQYENKFPVQKDISSTKRYFQYKNIYSSTKIYFQYENKFPVQKYISSTKIYLQYKNIFPVQKYLQYKNKFTVQKHIYSTKINLNSIYPILQCKPVKMAESIACLNCSTNLSNTFNFCPQCGTEVVVTEQSLIEYYFSRGFEYQSIISLLSKHNINMSVRTLKYRLKEYGLQRKLPLFNREEVCQRIQQELDGPGSMGGYQSVWHTLRSEGYQVPRAVVQEILREVDPEGCELRRAKRLRRRSYHNPGPNYCWHADGYDKLKSYGFPIHGCIDGWSRRMMWLRVERTNNQPEVIANYYLDCVEEVGGCPVKLRTDCGTENGIMAAIQCDFHGDTDAHIYGPSPANQRIEAWWSFYRRSRSTWWINYFKDLI